MDQPAADSSVIWRAERVKGMLGIAAALVPSAALWYAIRFAAPVLEGMDEPAARLGFALKCAAVAQHGWPTKSAYGEPPAFQAWLLAQHADHDPLLQLEVLRLMEPLAERGEVSKSNHAFLHDRIMLKLTGEQRYGTQVHCVDGKRRPRPLEDEAALDGLRAGAGLEPEADYLAAMDRLFGPCPPE
jgi:hypothetical protein